MNIIIIIERSLAPCVQSHVQRNEKFDSLSTWAPRWEWEIGQTENSRAEMTQRFQVSALPWWNWLIWLAFFLRFPIYYIDCDCGMVSMRCCSADAGSGSTSRSLCRSPCLCPGGRPTGWCRRSPSIADKWRAFWLSLDHFRHRNNNNSDSLATIANTVQHFINLIVFPLSVSSAFALCAWLRLLVLFGYLHNAVLARRRFINSEWVL